MKYLYFYSKPAFKLIVAITIVLSVLSIILAFLSDAAFASLSTTDSFQESGVGQRQKQNQRQQC
jgi:hypothetical protein